MLKKDGEYTTLDFNLNRDVVARKDTFQEKISVT